MLAESDLRLEVIQYHGGLDIELDLTGAELGTFLHRCFEVLGSNPEQVENLSEITGINLNEINSTGIANSVASFEGWLGQYFSA